MASLAYRKQDLTVGEGSMETLIFEPAGAALAPAVVVAQHLPVAHAGLETDPFTLDVGTRLAAAGYVAVIPYLFYRWPPQQDRLEKARAWRDDWNIADLDVTFDFTSSLALVDADRIGVMGHCWGGRVAWMAASSNARYRAAAMFYGGRMQLGLGPDAPAAVDLAPQIECPVLGVFGNVDQNPSPDEVALIGQALTDAGVDHEFHQLDGAGHGFKDFTNEERYRPTQTVEAWKILFEFLGRHLGEA